MHTFHIRRALQSLGLSTCFALAALLLGIPAATSTASAQVVLSVTVAPPALPVYTQPICPGDGYIWTPGYWSYSDDGGYFWVPGTWVEAPEVGFLWTPGYWGWSNGAYLWNAGYWGPEVGFYGGINYGFGYVGTGYFGGRWTDGHFFYNTRVNNVNVNVIHNTYARTVVVHDSHVSYNGGHGGVSARPTAAQERFAHENHTAPTEAQERHGSEARRIQRCRRSTDQSVLIRSHRRCTDGNQIRSQTSQRNSCAHRNEAGNRERHGIKARNQTRAQDRSQAKNRIETRADA